MQRIRVSSLALFLLSGVITPVAAQDLSPAAADAFRQGRLDAALAGYLEALEDAPDDPEALRQAAKLLLWKGRLEEAGTHLGRARIGEETDETRALAARLAERRGDLTAAAALRDALGEAPRAAQLRHLARRPVYEIVAGPAEAALAFVQTDPLPLVELSVNGSEPALFLVDTGGGELILDPAFAEKVGTRRFGERTGTFAADQKAQVELGAVDEVALGPFRVANVPVRLLPTARLAPVAGGREVSGILGTLLLSRFVFTLDYPRGQLVLRRSGDEEALADVEARVPFWLAGDHLILAEGRIGDAPPGLMLIDTGLAGGGFAAPASTLEEAGIAVGGDTTEGLGGGGRVQATPIAAAVSLGGAHRDAVPGFAGVFPPSLEHRLGCRIAGLISHGFLRPYAVTFDFERMEIVLQRSQA